MFIKATKLIPSATLPSYTSSTDAGLNLVATEIKSENNYSITYGTGITLEIPEGHVGLIFPNKDIINYTIRLSDSVGVIDSGNRDEITCTFVKDQSTQTIKYQIGEIIAKIIIFSCPQILITED